MKETKLMRIDNELAKQIREFSEKNQVSMIEASREINKIVKKVKNKRIIKEIKF